MKLDKRFVNDFECITGNSPFPWQIKLFNEFINEHFRSSCPIPTGLGKTSVIAIWLLSLAYRADSGTIRKFPRRLVYVVNRRTVVDQATREAEEVRTRLMNDPSLTPIANALRTIQVQETEFPLAISTLRGQFADNAEWRHDPARASVVIGTVDMIGSRLLFSGYGCGFKSRPLHAGFLGQESLLIHDEAHLEPAFQELIANIEKEQQFCHEFKRVHAMELTATSRSSSKDTSPLFTDLDMKHPEVKKRVNAEKKISLHPTEKNKIADKVSQIARDYKDTGQAILIFLRELKDVNKVYVSLCRVVSDKCVERLTGTLRGRERDNLAQNNPVFARFVRKPSVNPQSGTVYLICTSAGEVGVNMSADHLVCDLSPLDSMIQRFGRVNRFGDGDARIDVVHPEIAKQAAAAAADPEATENSQEPSEKSVADNAPVNTTEKKSEKTISPYERAMEQTLRLIRLLPQRENDHPYDASPEALAAIPAADRQAAFTPSPNILPANDILFDAWALTTVRKKLPGRPPVADWLHGVTEWEPPVTQVAWREEVDVITEALRDYYAPEDLLEDYPLKPQELLRDRTDRVFAEMERIAHRCPEKMAWLIDRDNNIEVLSLERLIEKNRQEKPLLNLADCTILLSPKAGGLKGGMLDGDAVFDESDSLFYDIADEWLDEKHRLCRRRQWDELSIPNDMRLVRTIDNMAGREDALEESEPGGPRYWRWYVLPRSADDEGSRTARRKQELSAHLQLTEHFAGKIVAKLGLGEPEASAVIRAARWHDLGKDRLIWQRSIGNHSYPHLTLAKSGEGMKTLDITHYRHEFGSLNDVAALSAFNELSADCQDLVLHLIAAHHGRARPHFPDQETFDYGRPESMARQLSLEIPPRFGRLQRKYGRWGLAYLESLLRAADILASREDDVGKSCDQSGQGGDQ